MENKQSKHHIKCVTNSVNIVRICDLVKGLGGETKGIIQNPKDQVHLEVYVDDPSDYSVVLRKLKIDNAVGILYNH